MSDFIRSLVVSVASLFTEACAASPLLESALRVAQPGVAGSIPYAGCIKKEDHSGSGIEKNLCWHFYSSPVHRNRQFHQNFISDNSFSAVSKRKLETKRSSCNNFQALRNCSGTISRILQFSHLYFR